MRIAQFKTGSGYLAVSEITEHGHNIPHDWVRVSEIIDVEFPARKQGEVTAEKVQQLDKVLAELMTQIESVRAKKSELLALSYQN